MSWKSVPIGVGIVVAAVALAVVGSAMFLTDKGEELCRQIAEAEKKHAEALALDAADAGEFEAACQLLRRLETSWSEYLRYDTF